MIFCKHDYCMTYQLRHRLLRLGLRLDIDAKRSKMPGQVRVDLGVVADVTVDI